ncbi:hypothetical protein L873DRAFT_1230719 [Choiromyces venosus 120613-1]|uniref:Uncharacterized protein n=1 Tax=Choiromyces venosus 120613-1 TaxID=1336337 RepID=A0A3N4JGU0_9PEZI|nr:hypothetical protein L873DRAFT_1230719 [Choiromyces venosus 120613-1]
MIVLLDYVVGAFLSLSLSFSQQGQESFCLFFLLLLFCLGKRGLCFSPPPPSLPFPEKGIFDYIAFLLCTRYGSGDHTM